MAKAQVTSKGQITVPKEIREYLTIQTGDKIEFVITVDGSVVVRPCKFGVNDLKGSLNRKGKKVSFEEMEKAIKKRRRG